MALMNYQTVKKTRKPRDFVKWNDELHEVKERDGVHCMTYCGIYARGESVTDGDRQRLGRTCTGCHKGTDIIEIGRDESKPVPLALNLGSATSHIANLVRPKGGRRRW